MKATDLVPNLTIAERWHLHILELKVAGEPLIEDEAELRRRIHNMTQTPEIKRRCKGTTVNLAIIKAGWPRRAECDLERLQALAEMLCTAIRKDRRESHKTNQRQQAT